MIDTKELRRLAQAATKGPWRVDEVGVGFEIAAGDNVVAQAQSIPRDSVQHTARRANAAFIAAANPAAISELLDRLEAAERERDEFKRACFGHISDNSMLRAKIEAMEKQEPVGKFIQHPSNGLWEQDGYGDNPDARPLYALPGAQTQGEEK